MTTTTKTEFATKAVAVIDDAIVITFVSDGTEKKKTLPLTEKGLSLKKGIADIFKMPEYNINNIWKDIKEGWVLYDCVIDLAAKAKANEAVVNDAFAKLGLTATADSNPIDEL